jgi:hypothetical protein
MLSRLATIMIPIFLTTHPLEPTPKRRIIDFFFHEFGAPFWVLMPDHSIKNLLAYSKVSKHYQNYEMIIRGSPG